MSYKKYLDLARELGTNHYYEIDEPELARWIENMSEETLISEALLKLIDYYKGDLDYV